VEIGGSSPYGFYGFEVAEDVTISKDLIGNFSSRSFHISTHGPQYVADTTGPFLHNEGKTKRANDQIVQSLEIVQRHSMAFFSFSVLLGFTSFIWYFKMPLDLGGLARDWEVSNGRAPFL